MQQSRKKQKQKAFLVSETQNPPAEGRAHVSLDFADVVIDGMTASKNKCNKWRAVLPR